MNERNERHDCMVTQISAFLSDEVLFQVNCPTCGVVGNRHLLAEDAQAVAEHHEKQGGFRPRSS